MSDRSGRNSGGEPASSAPPASASEDRRSEGAPTPEAPHASASFADAPSEAPQSSDQPEPEPGEERENHEARLERDLDELTAKAQKADEYLELAQRTKADFENFRKRAARETAAAQERGAAKLAKELLPAIDNLDRAVAAVEGVGDGGDVVSGIKLVHAEVIAALERAGVELY